MLKAFRTALLLALTLSAPAVVGAADLGVQDQYDADQLPVFIRNLVADERIVVHVTENTTSWSSVGAAEKQSISIVTGPDATIQSVKNGTLQNKTFEVLLTGDTLRGASTGDAQQGLIDAYQRGDIKYRGVGTWNRAFSTATNTVASAASSAYNAAKSVGSWFS